MKKDVYNLTISPDFQGLVDPLTDAEYAGLEYSIMKDGCLEDLITWNGIVIDGHNRYRICHEHNIPFGYKEMKFEDEDAAQFWAIEHALSRRNACKYQRVVLALKKEEILSRRAKQRMLSGVKADPVSNSIQGSGKGRTLQQVADMAEVGMEYVYRVKKIEQAADAETKLRLRREEATVNAVYNELFPKRTKDASEDGAADAGGNKKADVGICGNDGNSNSTDEDCGCNSKEAMGNNTTADVTNAAKSVGSDTPGTEAGRRGGRHERPDTKEAASSVGQTGKLPDTGGTACPIKPGTSGAAPVSAPATIGGEEINGIAITNGKVHHTPAKLPDDESGAEAVRLEVEIATRNYEMSIQDALERYTSGMASSEMNAEILKMIKRTSSWANKYASEYLSGLGNNV